MAKSNLALPENRTTYQEYYLTFQKIINTDVKIYEHWLRIQSGFSREVHLEGIRKNIELSDGLRYELYDITYVSKVDNKNSDKTPTRSLLKSLLIYTNCDILALYNERKFKQNKL